MEFYPVFVIFLVFHEGEAFWLQKAFVDIVEALTQRNHLWSLIFDEYLHRETDII